MYKIPVYSQCCLVMLQFSSRAQHIQLLAKWEEMKSAQLSAGPSLTHSLVLQVLSEQNLAGFRGSFAGESAAEGPPSCPARAVCVEVTQMAYGIPKKK